jgi:hypothetical protein
MPDPISKIKQKLQAEIDQLEHELNVELPKEIAVARAHGDLSENAEYKFAKERQGFVNARIGQLKKRMGDLGMLNLANIPRDRSGYGSRISSAARKPTPTRALSPPLRPSAVLSSIARSATKSRSPRLPAKRNSRSSVSSPFTTASKPCAALLRPTNI